MNTVSKHSTFKKQYRDLEQRVLRDLRDAVENSTHISKHTDGKAIKVNVTDYQELTIVNDRLTFLDGRGMEYSVWADADLEDLIDILCTVDHGIDMTELK